MRRRFGTSIFAAALTFAVLSGPAAAEVTVGIDNSMNCIPFGCGFEGSYQQVYAASAFSANMSIGSFTLFDDNEASGGILPTATYNLAFYLTDTPVNGLSVDPIANRGTLLANFGTFTLSGLAPVELTFDGLDFTYDNSAGNLLLDVTTIEVVLAGDAYFQTDALGTTTSRALGGQVADTYGLVTRFNEAAAVPEPAAWVMMILGFGIVGAAMRIRKAGSSRLAESQAAFSAPSISAKLLIVTSPSNSGSYRDARPSSLKLIGE